jgi:hypothetical protein
VSVIDLKIYCANMAVNGVNGNSSATSGDQASITPGNTARRLNVAIVGAGIGGLTAAVGLRRSGHIVAVGLNLSPSKPVLLA